MASRKDNGQGSMYFDEKKRLLVCGDSLDGFIQWKAQKEIFR